MEESFHRMTQLDASCWQIEEKSERLNMSCFLAVGKEKAVLVDSGFGRGNIREVAETLTSLPIMLVNTHADWDHVNGNKLFSLAHMHPADYNLYHKTVGLGSKEAPVAPLWEGDVIDLGGRCFEVVLIPGHTPGSILLIDEENRVAIGGDSLQIGMVFMFEEHRSLPAYKESMIRLKALQGRFDKIYAAHNQTVVDSAIIDELIAVSEKALSGEIEGAPAPVPFEDSPAKLYQSGMGKLLY
jgi:glyoxylase-like metal-dependent hydrolase (beta-lactamase superfamily II)